MAHLGTSLRARSSVLITFCPHCMGSRNFATNGKVCRLSRCRSRTRLGGGPAALYRRRSRFLHTSRRKALRYPLLISFKGRYLTVTLHAVRPVRVWTSTGSRLRTAMKLSRRCDDCRRDIGFRENMFGMTWDHHYRPLRLLTPALTRWLSIS